MLKTNSSRDGKIKLTVDQMLGKLARWIRLMGYDVYYPAGNVSDNEIIEVSKNEGRILITKDYELYSRYPLSIYELYSNIDDQLYDFVFHFRKRTEEEFKRCPVCNGKLVKVYASPHVLNHRDLYRCEFCGKLYWKGTHYKKIYRKLKSLEKKSGAGR
ncbi:hypothetical protein [Thermoplasma volcanium GSS1]|uniref:Mut7-C RNAse domain-containing protein n=1 Tax=Thermoplasma volcanium (strain ATCC 51530 / DSM 4299 / JCM 9571 / NBRC 15438 / GSS1) TaxID=273116 RepID=Q97BJ4_THEVO|nr:Mut7-C RNAse domain-containing protein [Thermoplasma volcanium]BAB59603.1 hypothetical protein [Thermoplasma volcanium GSS1]